MSVPRIAECFLSLECTLLWERPLCEPGDWNVLCGRIAHLTLDRERFNKEYGGRYGPGGYLYNIHSPRNPFSGNEAPTKIGYIDTIEDTWTRP